MKKERWFEDQPILKADLDREQASKEGSISDRLTDVTNYGVVLGSQLLGESSALLIQQGPNAGLFITVNTGVAYSSTGERIPVTAISAFNSSAPLTTTDNGIGATVLTPLSTGSQNIPVTNNATNSIWLGYLETTDTSVFTLSDITHERLFIKHDDGFEIQVTTTSTNPDSSRFVLIGEVVTSGGVVTSINAANSLEVLSVGPVAIPGSPYQIALSQFANLPVEAQRPASIPVIAGFTYTAEVPAAGQFTVNFATGVVTFNAADTGSIVTASYLSQHTRRQLAVAKNYKVGGTVTVRDIPSSYQAGAATTFTDHINARGSGVISATNPHGMAAADIGLAGVADIGSKLASSGIATSSGDASATSSSLSPSAVSAFLLGDNKVTIAPLIAGETVNVNGTLITATDIPTTITFDFIDPDTLLALAAGTYVFYVDSSTRTIARAIGAAPLSSFAIASVVWDGSKLLLPVTDLRKFGTTGKANIRLETLLALAAGVATDTRLSTLYSARLVGSVVVTAPSYAYTALGGTTLNVTVDGTPDSVTFPASPVNTSIVSAVDEINSQISGIKAVKTPTNQIKLLAPVSLVITGGAAAPILGFPVSPALGSSDSGLVKEIRVSGSTSTIGVGGEGVDAEVAFTYDLSDRLTQVLAYMGNSTLTTTLTYNADDTLKTVQETVS